ncbi:HEAT repeat domain-containing protein [Actinomycetota bacterium Odt1-20B]
MKHLSAALGALTDRDPDRRDVAAASLGDLLRGTALDTDTARQVVGRLVSLTVNEPATRVRESALNAVSEAFNHHSLPLDLVRPLAASMPTMEPELRGHAIYILGATRAPKALPMVAPFLNHPGQNVREEARLVAAEITASRSGGTTHSS